jgi:hypothetical protein
MSTPEIDPELHRKVASLTAADFIWRKRTNRSLAVWLIAGSVVGVGTWFTQKPIDRDETMFWGVFALGFATWFFGCMLNRMLFPKPDIKCPQCGNDRTLSEEYPINLLTWKCCPGCELKINDEAGWPEKL